MLAAPDEVSALRAALQECRAEAMSLRLDLAEACGFVEALEAELWAATQVRNAPGHSDREPTALNLLLQARTLVRHTLFQELGLNSGRAAALHDLRIAEVAFRFLLGLQSLRRPSYNY
jgi:hypothetical protein